jgi:DNA-binding transcriptional LysR family regulator
MKDVRGIILILGLMLLAACGPWPRDIEGTRDRVETSRIIRVGIPPLGAQDRALAATYLGRLARATGAQPRLEPGAAEPLLARLEAGELDLVLGEVARDSPWLDAVAVIEPLAERPLGERVIGFGPIARNGENRWIMLLEREVRDQRGGGG